MGDVSVLIKSLNDFYTRFEENIQKVASTVDSEKVLELNERERFQYLIKKFNKIAVAALVETLIDVGYKSRKGSKWNPKNW